MLFSALVHDPARGRGHRPVDLEVDEGVTLRGARALLAALTGDPAWADARVAVTCGGRGLDGTHVAGTPPWVHGSVLVAGPSQPDPEEEAARAAWHVAVTAGPGAGGVAALDDRLVVVPGPGAAGSAPARRAGAEPHARLVPLEDAGAASLVVRRRGRRTSVRRVGRTPRASRTRLVLRGRRLGLVLPVGRWPVPWPRAAALRTGASALALRERPTGRRDSVGSSVPPSAPAPVPLAPLLASVVGGAALAVALRQPWLLAAALAAPVATLLARPRRRHAAAAPPSADVAALAVGAVAPPWPGAAADPDGTGGALAVVGSRADALAAARTLALAAVAARATLAVLTDRPADWAWTRWARPLTSQDRLEETAGSPRLVVADGPAATARLAARVPAAALDGHVLVVAGTPGDVPAWCRRSLPADGLPGVGPERAERLVRRLAGRSAADEGDAPDGAGLPAQVPLGALPGVPAPTAADVARSWGRAGHGRAACWTRVPIGRGPRGVAHLDLCEDGPHLLVAGTTGAGKSELLSTLVLALALQAAPERLALVLVDFKGGTGLGPLAGLPHVVDHVSDLDPSHASRLLVGLRAELRRRERALGAAGARDLDELAPAGRPPRLVVVVDELRALVDDLPDAAPELARLAAQGRALGVHLVLATQRPAGAVAADLRANLGTRVALRVRDREDSLDVVDSDAAARIGRREAGRAVVRRPGAPVEHVQVARTRRAAPSVVRLAPAWPGDAWVPESPARGPAADLADWVAAARAAANGRRPAVPWLPELPARVGVDELVRGLPAGHGGSDGLVLALADLPEQQRREVLRWSPDAGHLLVAGAPASGRTTALVTVATQALARGRHVHAVGLPDDALDVLTTHDGPPPWAAALGTVLPASQPRATARLLERLARPTPGARPLLVVDGLPAVLDALAGVGRGAGADLLTALLRTGRGAVVAAGADSRTAASALAAAFAHRLLLRSPDPEADALLGVPPALRTARTAPGRAVALTDGRPVLCQVPLPPAPARTGAPGRGPRPVLVRALPERCVAAGAVTRGPAAVPVGLGGDDACVLHADLSAGLLVAGPPGSGRSTALRGLTRALRGAGVRVLVAPAGPDPVPASGTGHLDGDRPAVLVVDDADERERAAPGWLDRVLDAHPGASAVLATSATAAASAFRGPVAGLVAARRLLVLDGRDPASAQLLGADAARAADPGAPPGRGVLVQRGRVEPVQVFDAPSGRPPG